MERVSAVTGIAAPFLRGQVDTDVIIRIERLTNEPREKLGDFALEALRRFPDGNENPEFILNQPAYRGAPILLAGENFGCGSSREGAVWALMGMGIRCVIAPSFGDIFHNNCFQNGMLPVVLPEAEIERLAEAARLGEVLTVDLEAQEIRPARAGSNAFVPISFPIDPRRREALLLGLDDLGQTLRMADEITAWQARDRAARPWIWDLDETESETLSPTGRGEQPRGGTRVRGSDLPGADGAPSPGRFATRPLPTGDRVSRPAVEISSQAERTAS